MYEVKYVHIFEDEKGKKMVSVCLDCPGTKTGPLMGTYDDHEIHVTVPFNNPEAIVPAVKAKMAELKKRREEEAIFYSKLKEALKRA